MSYLFPAAFLLHTFSMTALMIGLGLAGKSSLAADVGIVQGATLALFYAFSANARNMILNLQSSSPARFILVTRLLLVLPLAAAAFFLSILGGSIEPYLAMVLILRRSLEWLSEVQLSEMERTGNRDFAMKFVVLQSSLLLLAYAWILADIIVPLLGLFIWALSPAFLGLRFAHEATAKPGGLRKIWPQFLPHIGSTAIIGISVYVFRLLILLITGKETAGDLYTAFAIGGFMGSLFTNALGPSMALHEARTGQGRFPHLLRKTLALSLVMGALIFFASRLQLGILDWTGKSPFFWSATGLSMIGGVVMVYAQRIRMNMLQHYKNQDLFGPDVMMNIMIIASVPLLYFAVSKQTLAALYLISSVLAFTFYLGSLKEKALIDASTPILDKVKAVIAVMLLLPLFFQVSGGLFRDPAMIFDSGGILTRLPIPVSVFACFGGILVLGVYKQTHLSLSLIFFTFVLMVMSSIIATGGQPAIERARLILLVQFILPMFALVLGQLFEATKNNSILVEKAFLYTLTILVPLQLLVTWAQGNLFLSPYLYLFSIYQHLQYLPVIIVCSYLLVFYRLGQLARERRILLALAPFMGIYAVASTSGLAMLLLFFGILGLVLLYRWNRQDKGLILTGLLSLLIAAGYLMVLIKVVSFVSYKFTAADQFGTTQMTPGLAERIQYWDFYAKETVSSSKTFLLGHAERLDRLKFPSAHNYYLDFIYNFGSLPLLPMLGVIVYTLALVLRNRRAIYASPGLMGLTLVVVFLLLVDNFFKVGLRQPYPGIITFFLWGTLLSKLSVLSDNRAATSPSG